MPTIYLNWGNLSENYAKPFLYRYNGSSWVQRGTGVWAVQDGWGPWYRDDNNQRIGAWTWGGQPQGYYAIQVKFQSYYTASQTWGPVEWGWTDTNQFDAVGPTWCWVGNNRDREDAPPDPPTRNPAAAVYRAYATCAKGASPDGRCSIGSAWGGRIVARRGSPSRYRLCVSGPREKVCKPRKFNRDGEGWASAWRWFPEVAGKYRFTWKVDGEFAGSDRLRLLAGD